MEHNTAIETASCCPVCGSAPVVHWDVGYTCHCPRDCMELNGDSHDRDCAVDWWNEHVVSYLERAR